MKNPISYILISLIFMLVASCFQHFFETPSMAYIVEWISYSIAFAFAVCAALSGMLGGVPMHAFPRSLITGSLIALGIAFGIGILSLAYQKEKILWPILDALFLLAATASVLFLPKIAIPDTEDLLD